MTLPTYFTIKKLFSLKWQKYASYLWTLVRSIDSVAVKKVLKNFYSNKKIFHLTDQLPKGFARIWPGTRFMRCNRKWTSDFNTKFYADFYGANNSYFENWSWYYTLTSWNIEKTWNLAYITSEVWLRGATGFENVIQRMKKGNLKINSEI